MVHGLARVRHNLATRERERERERGSDQGKETQSCLTGIHVGMEEVRDREK